MQTLRAANGEDLRIEACEGIEATDDEGGVIMLGFYRKGVAVLLTYQEALALGGVLNRISEAARPQTGGENDYRAPGARP